MYYCKVSYLISLQKIEGHNLFLAIYMFNKIFTENLHIKYICATNSKQIPIHILKDQDYHFTCNFLNLIHTVLICWYRCYKVWTS